MNQLSPIAMCIRVLPFDLLTYPTMIILRKEPFASRPNFRIKLGIILTLSLLVVMLCLLSSGSQAQSRFTYGLEAGGGASEVNMSFLLGGTTPYQDQWVDVTFFGAQNARRAAWQAGGYVRYYVFPAVFAQSGLYYASDGGEEELIKRTLLSNSNDLGGGAYSLRQYHQRVTYRFHYAEVPLLAGVRLFGQVRLYGGFTWGLLLSENTEVRIADPYQLMNRDRSYTNARVGIGVDANRFSVDVSSQKTVSDNKGGWDATAEVPSYFEREGVYNGASGINITKVLATISYRLH